MKRLLLGILALSAVASAGELLGPNASADLRMFYFDRGFNNATPNAKALTAGGIFTYKTDEIEHLSAVASYFGSYKLPLYDREDGKNTALLTTAGEDISFLGELYAQYKYDTTVLRIGRQRLNTPLANDHDLRLLPSSYNGATLTTSFSKTTAQLGYINEYSNFGSKDNTFHDHESQLSADGLGYIYITSTDIPTITINLQYMKTLTDKAVAISDYYYGDVQHSLDYILPTLLIKAQAGGNTYLNDTNSFMYGLKLEGKLSDTTIALLYNKIESNSFKALEAGPMFADWQQGYGNYEPSTAYGIQLSRKLLPSLDFKVGAVLVTANEQSVIDDFTEYNADSTYTINASNKFRLRYSIKDQRTASLREDRTDFRAIYYLSF